MKANRNVKCKSCGPVKAGIDRGRAMDGRRAYRCQMCGGTWTQGMQGRQRQYSVQRPGYQFANTGAASDVNRLLGNQVTYISHMWRS